MLNSSLETVDGRPALRFERRLDHSAERVWRAITAPTDLAQWFVAPVDWKPELGEVFESLDQTGEITELQPQRVLAWTWGGELFRFELRPDGDRSLLVFTHVFDNRADGAQHATGWELYFERLEVFLAGRTPPSHEKLMEAFPELHERYAAALGLDPEVGRRAFAEMRDQAESGNEPQPPA